MLMKKYVCFFFKILGVIARKTEEAVEHPNQRRGTLIKYNKVKTKYGKSKGQRKH